MGPVRSLAGRAIRCVLQGSPMTGSPITQVQGVRLLVGHRWCRGARLDTIYGDFYRRSGQPVYETVRRLSCRRPPRAPGRSRNELMTPRRAAGSFIYSVLVAADRVSVLRQEGTRHAGPPGRAERAPNPDPVPGGGGRPPPTPLGGLSLEGAGARGAPVGDQSP